MNNFELVDELLIISERHYCRSVQEEAIGPVALAEYQKSKDLRDALWEALGAIGQQDAAYTHLMVKTNEGGCEDGFKAEANRFLTIDEINHDLWTRKFWGPDLLVNNT